MSGVKVGALAVAEGDFLRLEVISQGCGDGHRGLLRLDFLEEGRRPAGFLRGGQAGEENLIKAADLGGFIARDFLHYPGGEGFTAFQHEGAVEEQERLDRRRGHVARGGAAKPLRCVEDVGERVAVIAHDAREDAAHGFAVDDARSGLLVGLEVTTGREDGIADLLGLQALGLEAPE